MSKKKLLFWASSFGLLVLVVAGAVFGQVSQKSSVFRPLSIFAEVFDLVENNYVEPVSGDKLMDGAFTGITDALDEFSFYVPPDKIAAFRAANPSEDNPLGLMVTKRFGYAFIVSPIPGSPASKAGIERGDFIEKIGSTPTAPMSLWQIRSALQVSAPVDLQIIRGGQTRREVIHLKPVAYHPLPFDHRRIGAVEYVRVPYFEKGSAAQLRTLLGQIRNDGSRKLIVDIRGNAGGDVNEAIAAADEFLTSGRITSITGKKVEHKEWQADRATDFDGDLEVLTDPSTAGPAEVFAAAIHANHRGKTVGLNTYGKSLVQKFIPLESGGGVQMTVGHYTTPEGKPIKEGIKPDVLVDLTVQAMKEPDTKGKPNQAPREDLILEKALGLFGQTSTEYLKNAA